jgi:anti-anti-sigma regulatory factor
LATGEAPLDPARTAPAGEADAGSSAVPIGGRVTPADVPDLAQRIAAWAGASESDHVVPCDVSAVAAADAVTVDTLTRLQLTVRRQGRSITLVHASPELKDLFRFMGLAGAVRWLDPSGLETRREAEEREPAGGVEEEGDPGDSIA